jgi:GH25 family lysozyme M1 (1,4-beta-N-acetylmuramidase)
MRHADVLHCGSFFWFFTIVGFAFVPVAPHSFAQRPLGIDVSHYQGQPNWTSVRSSGITFSWAKASEGISITDAQFTYNTVNGKAAGVYMGAYHFARPNLNSPAAEASQFWSVAGNYILNDGLSLMPMLDMEVFSGVVGASSYSDWANQWCNAIVSNAAAQGVTVRPVIYVSSCNACNFDSSIAQWIAWLANYNGLDPQTGNPWNVCTACEVWGANVWNAWQYSSTTSVPGITGNVDGDVFNGTAAGLVSLLVIGGAGLPAITNPPVNVTVGSGGPATFSVGAGGPGPLSYQWRFNQAPIPGASLSSYTIAAAQPANAGGYSVTVTNSHGSVSSANAFLSVLGPLVNAPGAILAPGGLVDWWPAEGNTADIYGPYNGTPVGGSSYVTGKEGLAFHFDGSSGRLSTGGPSIAAPWTVCLWVNRQNAPGSSAALMSDGTYSLKLEQYNGTRKVGVTQLGIGDFVFNYTAPAGTWVHLAFVGTASGTSLYTNGVLQGSITNVVPLPRGYLGATYVASGNRFVDYLLAGMDEVLCFNSGLSGAEINAIYAAGAAGLVRSPEFTAITPLGNNQVRLNLRGLTGKSFTIYSSSDLGNWTPLGTIPNPIGAAQFLDSGASERQTFYRARQP